MEFRSHLHNSVWNIVKYFNVHKTCFGAIDFNNTITLSKFIARRPIGIASTIVIGHTSNNRSPFRCVRKLYLLEDRVQLKVNSLILFKFDLVLNIFSHGNCGTIGVLFVEDYNR